MTREEAIEALTSKDVCNSDVMLEALETAIKALEQEPCEDDKPCTECPKYDKEKHYCPHFCHVIRGVLEEKEPCEDCISRQAALNAMYALCDNLKDTPWRDNPHIDAITDVLDTLPSVTPKFTDAEIQKMQEMEQAEIQKAYELGKKISVLDKIRDEITNIHLTDTDGHNNNWYREPQAIINDALQIIDRYKAESEEK